MNDDEALAALRQSLTAVRDSLDGVRMERPVNALFARARARRMRRTLAVRTAVACGVAAATVAGVLTVNSARNAEAQASAAAYVTGRVQRALANENLVSAGSSYNKAIGNTFTWAYGSQARLEEFSGSGCGHSLPNGACTHRGGSELYLTEGTAIVGGKLTGAYITYFDRKYSLSGPPVSQPTSACSPSAALAMGGSLIPATHWFAFISATLACGAATVTGHVEINRTETTKITGKPVTVRLSKGYGKSVGAKWATARWTLYVNSRTFLPVRIYGSTESFGGPAATDTFSSVTNVRWLPPTAANIAMTLVTIPAGYLRVRSPSDQ
ncbi:MAG TPA: hypothetical protein VHY31_02665 [Streptosporangiaceae bacterium]|nr:hypothetical protein [Streptosporangiaceae bacterium]